MKTIALVEYHWIGHYIFYMKAFTKIFIQCGYRVAIYCTNPVEMKAWAAKEVAGHASQITVYNLTIPKIKILQPLLKRHSFFALQKWLTCFAKIVVTRSTPEYVFFLSVDDFIIPREITCFVNALFKYKWFCLFVHPNSFRTSVPSFYTKHDFLSIFRSSHCKAVFVLDEGVVAGFNKTINKNIVHAIPDIADVSMNEEGSQELKSVLLAKAKGRKIVGLYSPMFEYKGAMTLIKVAETTENRKLFFFVCGLFKEEGYSSESYARIQSLMAACPENMHFVSGFIEDEGVFNSLFNSADIIFAAFHKFYSSSNTLTKAAFFKKPVVVSKGFCMAERVEKYKLGISIPEADAVECSRALNELESKYGAYVNRADFTSYYNLHSEQALLQIVRTII